MKRRLQCLAVVAALTAARPVRAHHPVSSPLPPNSGQVGRNLSLRSRVGLQHEVAEFQLDGRGQGQWHATTLYGEYLFLNRFSVGASLPLAHVRYRDGHRAWGLGDAELNTRVRVLDALDGRLNLLVGLGVELPTGPTADGLGDGHVMLSPQVGLVYTARNLFSLALTISDHFGMEDKEETLASGEPTSQAMHAGAHSPGKRNNGEGDLGDSGSVLAPHSEHEMRSELTAMYQYRTLYGFVSPSLVVQWTSDVPIGPIEMSGGIGVLPSPAARLELKVGAPVHGEKRSNWRASLGLEVWF